MPALLPVIGTALLAAGAVVETILASTVLSTLAFSTLLNVAASKLFGPKVPGGVGLRGIQVMSRSALEYRKIVYGQAMVSGPVVYNNVSGTDNEYLWYDIALVHGLSEDLVSVWLDGDEIPKADIDWAAGTGASDGTGTGDVSTAKWIGDNSQAAVQLYYYLGDDAQPVSGDLNTAFADIDTNNRGRGVTHLVCQFLYNVDTENVWKQGQPRNIKAVIKGRKVYDPRLDSTQTIDPTTSPITLGSGSHRTTDSTTWAWSENPALCVADYLFNIMGVTASSAIDWASIADSADDCDVLVVVPPAASPENTEARFTCNGALSLGSTHKDNLDALLSSCDGKLSYSGGVWKLRASVWEASSVTITANDLAGSIDVRGSSPRSERFNTVRGFFIDPARKYEPAEFPHVFSSTYITRDAGDTISYDLELPMTNTETMAQRIAIRNLFQSDNQILATLNMNVRGAKVKVGDVVTVDLPELGWTAGGNLLLQSEDISTTWANTRTTDVTNVTPAPFGTASADSINEDGTAASTHYIGQAFTGSDNTVYTLSAYLKKSNRAWAALTILNQAGTARTAYFDLGAGQIGTIGASVVSSTIESAGNGWYRCSVSVDIGAAGANEACRIWVAEGDGDVTFSGLTQESILVCGIQLEATREPGLYQKTTSAAVTTTTKTFRCIEWGRNADSSCKVTLKEDISASYTDPVVGDYSTGAGSNVTVPSDTIPAPTGLTATAVPVGIQLDWTNPPASTFDYIEVYEDTNDTWSGATTIAQVRADTLTVSHDSGTTYYYWVRAIKLPDETSLRSPDSDTTTISAASTGAADGADGTAALMSGRQADDLLDWWAENTQTTPLSGSLWSTVSVSGAPVWPDAIEITDNAAGLDNFFSNRTTIDATKKFRVQVQAKRTAGDRNNYFFVAFYDSAGLLINTTSTPVSDAAGWTLLATYHYFESNIDIASSWTQYSQEFGGGSAVTIPTGAVAMAIGMLGPGAGTTSTTVQIQDFYVTELSEDGASTQLTNESHVVAADNDGTNYSLTGAGGTHQVTAGAVDKTTSAVHEIVGGTDGGANWTKAQNGLTLTVVEATGVYSLSGSSWTSDSETFTLRATYNGIAYDKVYTIAKSKAGATGATNRVTAVGANISDAATDPADGEVSYRLSSNGQVYEKIGTGGSYTSIGTWMNSGANTDYEVLMTLNSGDAPTSGAALDSWIVTSTADSNRTWTLTETVLAGSGKANNMTIKWRDKTTLEDLGSATVLENADVVSGA